MSPIAEKLRRSADRIMSRNNRVGLVALVIVLATACFAVYRALPVLHAIRTGAAGSGASDDPGESTVTVFTAAMTRDADQINGRSYFFDPPPPPPPRVERPPPPPPVDPGPPPPPPPPSTYGGPKIVGVAFDTVWFDNNKTMRVGGPVENEMRVVSISPAPYVVKIEWKKVLFDVPFLPRDNTIIRNRPGSPAPEPAPETTPPATSPTEAQPGGTPPAPAPDKPADPAQPSPGENKEEKKDEPKPTDPSAPPGPAPESGNPSAPHATPPGEPESP